MTVSAVLLGRRAALTALAAAGILATLLVAALVYLIIGSESEETRENLADLARFRAETVARPQVAHALSSLETQAASLPIFSHGESDTLAQATLQSDIKKMVEGAGGEVRSAFALPPTKEHGLDLVSVQYDVTVPATRLHDLAYELETHLPYLFLTSMAVTAPQNWPTDPKAPEPQLELRWTVSSYRWSMAR